MAGGVWGMGACGAGVFCEASMGTYPFCRKLGKKEDGEHSRGGSPEQGKEEQRGA